MIPWVMVYAITGFLFNHSTFWPNEGAAPDVHRLEKDAFRGTALENWPTSQELAAQVTEELNRRSASRPYRLVREQTAHYNWHSYSAWVMGGGQEHRIDVEIASGVGAVQSKPIANDAAPFATVEDVRIRSPLPDRIKSGVPLVLEAVGLRGDKLNGQSVPELTFTLEAEGQMWEVRYDPNTGRVKGQPTASATAATFHRFLNNLHFSVGYPSSGGPRWYWALAVDAGVVCLTFWCISGLFMWWQIKAVRRAGVVVLLSSVLMAGVLALAMYGVFNP
jgi:hypothetical protein